MAVLPVAYHVPNAMFEFVFEGALLPFTYSGDRFVLLALLPRRKPRTAQCSCLFACVSRRQNRRAL